MHDDRTCGDRFSVALNQRQLYVLRVAALDSLLERLKAAADEVDDLRQQRDLDEGSAAADTRTALKLVQSEVDALNALGWHDIFYGGAAEPTWQEIR